MKSLNSLYALGFVALTVSSQSAKAIVAADVPVAFSQSSRESLSEGRASLAIPRPGQNVLRPDEVATQDGARESVASNVEMLRDAVSGSLSLISGELGFSLFERFGGQDNFYAWSRSAQRSHANSDRLASLVKSHTDAYLKDNADRLGLAGLTLEFNAQKFFSDGESTLVSYDISLAGERLEGASVALRFGQGQLLQIALRTFGASQSTKILGQDKALSAEQINTTVRSVLGPTAALKPGAVSSVVVPRLENVGGKPTYTFIRAVKLEAVAASGELFSIVRSLAQNEVLEWYSMHVNYRGTVSGVVNNRTPGGSQSTQGMSYISTTVGGGIFGGGKTFSADARGTLEVPNQPKVTLSLNSTRFKVANQGGKKATVAGSGDLHFDAQTNSSLAETTAFYHLHLVQDWARELINPRWFSNQVPVNVNMGDVCNAFWNGSSVNFFEAGSRKLSDGRTVQCNNTGEIADVVYHEWGHGLDANTGGIEDRAYSEGIGDVVSMLMTGSPLVGPSFFKDGKPVRDMDGDYMYPPKADEREVHREGQIIGAAWYHFMQALESKYGQSVGRQTAKKLFLKSLFTTSTYTEVYKALLALDAEGGHPNQGPNFCLINTSFARHGLAKPEDTCR